MGTQKLIVKQEYLESEVCANINGRPYLIVLKNASHDELDLLLKQGRLGKKEGEKGDFDHLFVAETKPEPKEKK